MAMFASFQTKSSNAAGAVSREIDRGRPSRPCGCLHLSSNRFLIAVVDRHQQLAGFDDEMLLCVEKAIDVVPGGHRATFAGQLSQLASRREDRRNRLGKCDGLYCRIERRCLLAVSFGEIPDLGQRTAHCRGENQNEGRPGRPTNLLGLLKQLAGCNRCR
jgi:hypothetical protein